MSVILVTGATGFVGLHLVRRLIDAGQTVRALVRATSDRSHLEGLSLELVQGDLLQPADVRRAMAGCARVYHLAADTTYDRTKRDRQFAINVDGTRNVLDAACELGVERMVHVSTCAAINASEKPGPVYDENAAFELHQSGLNYSISKWQGEQLALAAHRERGLDVRICHPSEVYGEEDYKLVTAGNLLEAARSPVAMAIPGGTGVVYVGDLVEGFILAMERGEPGRRYILSAENFTVAEILRVVLDWLGWRRHIIMMPAGLLMAISKAMLALGVSPPLHPDVAAYACRYWFVDGSRARNELGWNPMSGRDAIGRALAWLKEAEYF